MKKRNILKNEKGFTLIEIIAVLILLGILAAVAVPKYLDLTGEAKLKAAQGQVAEMKGTLSIAWGKQMLKGNAGTVTQAQLLEQVADGGTAIISGTAFSVGTTPDNWSVSLTNDGTTGFDIAVISRGTPADTDYNATGKWNIP